jgi:hypothetical protein
MKAAGHVELQHGHFQALGAGGCGQEDQDGDGRLHRAQG